MKLVIDHFRPSGKWYETYSTPVSTEEVQSVQPSYDHDAWIDFFEKKAGYTVRSKEFTLFIRLEDELPEVTTFCRYLVQPNHPKYEYIPLGSF
jgi:hypothetical protein